MKKTIEYYLSKGFDEAAAKYYADGRKKIVTVLANDDFTLLLSFDNGEERLLDIKPMIKPKTIFAFLSSLDNFKRVYLDEQNCVSWDINPSIDSSVIWKNKVDLCPDSCYLDSIPKERVFNA